MLPLAFHPQGRPARDEHVRTGAARQQARDDRSRLERLLEVVQNEQHSIRGQPFLDRVDERARAFGPDT
jgi:hypothetical protein